MTLEEIKKITKEYPEYLNKENNGLHSLHYAALTKNLNVFDFFFEESSKQGLNALPKTTKEYKKAPKNVSFLGFCLLMDLDEVYARCLTFLVSPEEQDFKHHTRYSFIYNSKKTCLFLEKILGQEEYQKTITNTYLEDNKNIYTSNAYQIFMKNFSKNPTKFDEFGIDIKNTLEGGETYFTKTVKVFLETNDDLYNLDKEELKKLDNTIKFFINKGISINEKDGLGVSVLDLLEKFAENKKYEYNYSLIENIINEAKVNSLDKELAIKSKEKSKLKI